VTDASLVPAAPQLKEIEWLWRRWWSFSVTVIALAIVAAIVWTLREPGLGAAQAVALQQIAWGLIGTVIFIGLVYVVGATAYELTQLVQAARVQIAIGRGAPQ
jgi:hypothetical protein